MVRFAFPPNVSWNTLSLKGYQIDTKSVMQIVLLTLPFVRDLPFPSFLPYQDPGVKLGLANRSPFTRRISLSAFGFVVDTRESPKFTR